MNAFEKTVKEKWGSEIKKDGNISSHP